MEALRWADEDVVWHEEDLVSPELFVRQTDTVFTSKQLAELGELKNTSGRPYDGFVRSLPRNKTHCLEKGVLPVPLAGHDTCYPGWHCKHTSCTWETEHG